ncbi:MAG: hypothetical protein LBH56_02430 [Coriobacteriales bacterium]|jgi:hypothetical protein|nr:hypothetical protein [Coriobacteriales bacterium]
MSGFELRSTLWLTVLTGHYGVGKTNLALNLARDARAVASRVTLLDLDIVNPYFRSTDNQAFLDAAGVEVLGPVHAASNLDTPSLSPGIEGIIRSAKEGHAVFVDVGGDPDGARALGRFSATINARPYQMLFVVNLHRPEARSVADNLEVLRGIERASGVRATGIFGNTHLKEYTTAGDIVAAVETTRAIADAAGLPLVGISAPRPLADEVTSLLAGSASPSAPASSAGSAGAVSPADTAAPESATAHETDVAPALYPVDLIVATPWEASNNSSHPIFRP